MQRPAVRERPQQVLAASARISERRTVERPRDRSAARVDALGAHALTCQRREAARGEHAACVPPASGQARGARSTRRRGPASKPAARNAGRAGLSSTLSPSRRSIVRRRGRPRRTSSASAASAGPRFSLRAVGQREQRAAAALDVQLGLAVAQHDVRARRRARRGRRRASARAASRRTGWPGPSPRAPCSSGRAAPRARRAAARSRPAARTARRRGRPRTSRGGRRRASRGRRARDRRPRTLQGPARAATARRVSTPCRSSSSSAIARARSAGSAGCGVERRGRRPAPERRRRRARCGGARGGAPVTRATGRGSRRAARRAQRRERVVRDLAGRDQIPQRGGQLRVRAAPSSTTSSPRKRGPLASEPRSASCAAPCGAGAAPGGGPKQRRLVAVEQRDASALGADPDELARRAQLVEPRLAGSPRPAGRARRAPTRRARAAATAAGTSTSRSRSSDPRPPRSMPCQAGAKRAIAAGSTGSIARRSAATDARRIRRSTSGSHQSMPVPPGPQPAAHEPARRLERARARHSQTSSASP